EADGPAWEVRTRVTTLLGTPRYMSPEQCRGVGQVGAAADVYALGVVLYQLLTGQPPFVAEGVGELLAMHIYAPPPRLQDLEPELPAEVATLVHAMLEKDPTRRPSMQEVEQAIQGLAPPASAEHACLPD